MPLTVPPTQSGDVYVRGVSSKARDLDVRLMRLRFLLNRENGVYGPFTVPSLGDRSLVAMYAHPFAIVMRDPSNPNPDPSDPNVVRPYFSIRSPHRAVMFAGDQFDAITAIGAIGSDDVIPPPIEALAQRWGLPGDARADLGLQAVGYGVPTFDHQRATRITAIVKSEANPDDTALTDYTLALNSGATIVTTRAAASDPPLVGDPFPATQEEDRFSYQVGRIQRSVEATFPHQDGFAVQTLEDDIEQPHVIYEDQPGKIMSVETVADLPDNPSVMVKRVTLNSGATVTVPLSTPTVVGEEIGDSTTPDPGQATLETSEWWEILVFCVTAKFPDANADSLAGLAADPWPISVGGVSIMPST